MSTEPHLIPTTSDRGFTRLPVIPETHGGEVSVYESSAASGPHIWLRYTDPASKSGDSSAHLTVENALRLADQIQYLVANHYQRRP